MFILLFTLITKKGRRKGRWGIKEWKIWRLADSQAWHRLVRPDPREQRASIFISHPSLGLSLLLCFCRYTCALCLPRLFRWSLRQSSLSEELLKLPRVCCSFFEKYCINLDPVRFSNNADSLFCLLYTWIICMQHVFITVTMEELFLEMCNQGWLKSSYK